MSFGFFLQFAPNDRGLPQGWRSVFRLPIAEARFLFYAEVNTNVQ